MSQLVTGRSPFPLEILKLARSVPHDRGDVEVILRSQRLGSDFHGLVELEHVTNEALSILRAAGWKTYLPAAPSRRSRA
jgi:hypothetical protein